MNQRDFMGVFIEREPRPQSLQISFSGARRMKVTSDDLPSLALGTVDVS